MKEFNGIWIPYEVLTDKNLSDKEKQIYSMIIALSKENNCTMSNAYLSNLFNISTVQVSRIINELKKKGYIKVELIHKENTKEIAMRKCVPINKNVKDIIYNNKINYINNKRYKSDRDYSNFDFTKLYANNF